jgi:hypothetical protein
MAKLKLVANPTFIAKVGIPIAGADAADVVFTFTHRTKTQLDEFVRSRSEKADVDSVMEMTSGWDLEDPFTRENVETLLENYIGAAIAIFRVYVDQLVKAKLGN